MDESLRIALLTYRGNPRSGGQGVYTRLLSRELAELGHRVEVWSGQPYPELDEAVPLRKLPSLDLWNEKAFFRVPTLSELRDPIHRSEWMRTVIGGFPEPRTFSLRAARLHESESDRFDVIHDNQALGPGLLKIARSTPVVTTIHHPVTRDRKIALRSARNPWRWYGIWRWYGFLAMQIKVARRLPRVLTISQGSARDLVSEYGIDADRIRIVGNGIDVGTFRPIPEMARERDLLVTTLSNDHPLKGLRFLFDALVELRASHPEIRLIVVGTPGARTDTMRRVASLGLEDRVEFTGRITSEEIARLYARAALAIVPSLYEGFGFPAGEAMASGVPVVSTRAGALPEVVGEDGRCGTLVEPRSGPALAKAIRDLLGASSDVRVRMGVAGRERVLERFTWRRAAERTVEVYREAIAETRRRAEPAAETSRPNAVPETDDGLAAARTAEGAPGW